MVNVEGSRMREIRTYGLMRGCWLVRVLTARRGLLHQIVKPRHTTHRSENRVGTVEKSAFGPCPLAPRWSVTTALVRLRRIFPLVIAVPATLPLRFSPRCVLCRAI